MTAQRYGCLAMTDLDRAEQAADNDVPTDGRVARRQRNVDAVIDVVLEMFAEEAMFPSMEVVANRSGLSLRSLYRYFADPGELLEAAIKRSREIARDVSHLHAIGEGPLEERIEAFVEMRVRVYETIGARYRATVANAARRPRIQDELARSRTELSDQFAAQFAQELELLDAADRTSVQAAGDLIAQLDSIDFLRRHRQLSLAETEAALTDRVVVPAHRRLKVTMSPYIVFGLTRSYVTRKVRECP